jgi:hypothetical protein
MSKSVYAGQSIALATKHEKQRVIAPAFRRTLGAEITVANVDTDLLGTFSGEVERKGTPREVVLAKARLGATILGCPRSVATEGSFGPHPYFPFMSQHHEIIAFIDLERSIEVVEQRVFTRSVYDSTEFTSLDTTREFLARNHFGSYGMIVQCADLRRGHIEKGVVDLDTLRKAVDRLQAGDRTLKLKLSTDMRAHLNPLRMWRIRLLAKGLAHRLSTPCPKCKVPGWGVLRAEAGLPCGGCGEPTEAIHHHIWGCSACRAEEQHGRPDGRVEAEPGECSVCNP